MGTLEHGGMVSPCRGEIEYQEREILCPFDDAGRISFGATAGGRSACDCLIGELRNYMPGYAKGGKGIFEQVMAQTDQAVAFGKRALQAAEKAGTDNPTTRMHELAEYLKRLKR